MVAAVLVCATPAGALTPNDPLWYAAWGQRLVHMPQVWDITTGNPNIVIGVVDSGVDPNLPDLQGALAPGFDFITGGPVQNDSLGHGTAVSTIIAARGNNGTGITGYCWKCRVMPIRISAGGTFSGDRIANGIRYAVDHGVRIITLGFSDEGTGNYDARVAAAIAYASRRDAIVFSPAGNTGTGIITRPGSYPGTYAVAATDPNDVLYPFSTWGGWIPLAAPGCQEILWPGGSPAEACGTSVTGPALAGIAALMLSVNPGLTRVQIISAFQASMVPVAGIGGGRVDALGAFRAAGLAAPAGSSPPPAPAPPPPPDEGGADPTKPAFAARLYSGMLKTRRVVTLRLNAGRMTAILTSKKARSCSVSLYGPDGVEIFAPRSKNKLSVVETVPAGIYTFDISCRTRRPRPYTLSIIAKFTSGT